MASGSKRKAEVNAPPNNLGHALPYVKPSNKRLFLAINFVSTESILEHVPLVDGKGTERKIPRHFLGFDASVDDTLWKINEFRNLSQEEQDEEWKRWRSMKPREQRVYKCRIDNLIELQAKMSGKKSGTEPPAKVARKTTAQTSPRSNPTVNPPFSAPEEPQSVSHTQFTTATAVIDSGVITPASRSSTASVSEHSARNGALTRHSNDGPSNPSTSPNSLATHRADTLGVNPSISVQEPTALADVTNNSDSTSKEYSGLASRKEDRMNAMPTKKKSTFKPKTITREHKNCVPCQDISQQADVTSMTAVHRAVLAAGKAIDTISLPGRPASAPSHTLALIVLNNVKETLSSGGGTNFVGESWQRRKPSLTIVTSSKRDFKRIASSFRDVFKHRGSNHGYETNIFLHDECSTLNPEPLLVPKIKNYLEKYTEDRKNPSLTSRTWDDIQNEHAKENASN